MELFDVEYYRDLEMWVRGHSKSLKVIPFESYRYTVCYSPSITTMAVSLAISEIFSAKEWGRVRSRSLEMALFDRSHTSFYSPSIVTMALSCLIYEI